MKLTVRKLSEREAYSDIARVPHKHRFDNEQRRLERGEVCRLICCTTKKKVFVILRGTYSSKISIDGTIRKRLGVEPDKEYEFELERAGILGWTCWAIRSSDAQYSFAAKVSLLSLFLGLIALAIPFIQGACH
jgi:hypothetical protein